MIHLKQFKLLNRKKNDPNHFVFTGEDTSTPTELQIFRYSSDHMEEVKNLSVSDLKGFEDTAYNNWLNVWGLNDTDSIAAICKMQNIENLVIQDILDVNQRPKYQEFETYSFLTLKTTVPSEIQLEVEQISFVFGSNYLISFHSHFWPVSTG